MALWDNLSKKASGATEKAVQQAKVLAEVTRLNGVISDEKKKIENNYRVLGEQYAKLHHDDFEEAFAGIMTAILASEKLIADSQQQILDVKGVQCCANCGAELAKNMAFCSVCGTPTPKPKAPEGPVCAGCGAALAADMKFCVSCGTPVVQNAAEPEIAEEAAPVEEVAEETVPQTPVCPQCGAELEENALFCMNCGHKLG